MRFWPILRVPDRPERELKRRGIRRREPDPNFIGPEIPSERVRPEPTELRRLTCVERDRNKPRDHGAKPSQSIH